MKLFGIHINSITFSDILIDTVISLWTCIYLRWIFPSVFKSKNKNN